jgi:hypothetical protein
MGTSKFLGFIGSLIDPLSTILDKWIPDADVRQKIAYDIATLSETHAHAEILAQIEVNKAEAASGSLFKGGWRPACGWTCVAALFNNYVLVPYAISMGLDIPVLDLGELMPLLLGMLGLTAARSFEKFNGVASK